LNILLADDDRHLGTVIKQELEEENFTVDLVHDGVEAVLRFIENSYNLILLDITMPKLEGINALRIINRLNPGVPAIAFSGNLSADRIEDSLRAGAVGCLTKPFTMRELKDCIIEHSS
jgi:DNA-binding response OmpR family regulator